MTTAVIVLLLIVLKWIAQVGMELLNQRHVLARAQAVPEAFKGIVDEPTYAKSVRYTLARSRLSVFDDTYRGFILCWVLFSGLLPRAFCAAQTRYGSSAWAMAGFMLATGLILALPGLPIDWFEQFRLEQRFGFNTTTQRTWWLDHAKGMLLAALLGYPLLALVLKIVGWSPSWWWLLAWGAVLAVQIVMAVLAPVLILPLFNKFTPLPDGPLRDRLLELARRTSFRAGAIQVMDGSKRSRHSNAFFTGFGRFRKIILFDTLVQQLTAPQLESVLAHEIGHFKKKHIPKMLLFSALGSLAGFYAVSVLARQEWFYRAFGFEPGSLAPALLLFALLSGLATFWLSPLIHGWSRRHEYEADAFAVEAMAGPEPLIEALRTLHEKNLGNLTPHPVYSGFYYSHPTLLERERAMRKVMG